MKHYFLKEDYMLTKTILEWLVYSILINLVVIITILPFGSVIIAKCEEGNIHIQYGSLAIVMSAVYSIAMGIISAFISMNKADKRGKNEKNSRYN